MFGMTVCDLIVILVYFTAILYIGFRAMKNIKNQEDYFLGGRKFGKLVQIFASFGQATSSDHVVGTTTTTYNNGSSGIWSSLMMLWATPAYWLISPWYRRLRVLTLGDFFVERYGSKAMGVFYSLMASLFLMAMISVGLKAVSYTILGVTQKSVSELTVAEKAEYEEAMELDQLKELQYRQSITQQQNARIAALELKNPRKEFAFLNDKAAIFVICVVVILYAVAGGLEAAMYTDVLQSILILVLSFLMIPFGLHRINILHGTSGLWSPFVTLHKLLPESFFDVFGSTLSIDFTWYYIAAVSIMATVNSAIQPNQLTAIGSAKDEYAGRVGFTTGLFMKRFCILLWGLSGLIFVVLYGGVVKNSDLVWGYATRDLLGAVNMGLVGLMIACLMSALMSTASILMITTSGLMTNNVYKHVVKGRPEAHYVLVGRLSGAGVLIGAAFLATWFDSILQLLKFIWEFNAVLAAAFWCGMKWRGATRQGAWASMWVTVLLFVLLPLLLPLCCPILKTSEPFLVQTNPIPITRMYAAKQMDVDLRKAEIEAWKKRDIADQTRGSCPEEIVYGQVIKKTIHPAPKSVYWSKGVKLKDNQRCGDGLLYAEMLLVGQWIDLGRQPYALSETIRTLLRVLIPFSVLILVSIFTKNDDPKRLDQFYVKLRIPVLADKQEDEKQVWLAMADPRRFRDRLLFPKTSLEFMKWTRVDAIGFIASVLMVFLILGLLYGMLMIGK
jgi:SSS family solute:Na+ symporter